MAGGPVNGAPWAGVGGAFGAGAATVAARGSDPDDPANYTGIIIPTILQMASDALGYWTNMTCLYDRYWTPDLDKVTLPICMFHVTKITPVYSIKTSDKRVILYEPQGDGNLSAKEMADRLRENVMRSIIENSVKQPTTYNLEVIVPYQPIGRYVTEGVKNISDMIMGLSELLGGNAPGGFSDVWEGIFSSVFALLGTAQTASEIAGKLPGMDGSSYINMNSLEAMAESCRTLCMKMWTGYDYKYVQITNMSPDRRGKEDDIYRTTLTVQEKPVLAISRPKDPSAKQTSRHWTVTATAAAQGALVSPLIGLTGVKTAAGGGKSKAVMIKDALGG